MTGMTGPIWVSLGKKRYVGGTISEVTGKDISGATYTIGLATQGDTPPTVWSAPDVSQRGASASQWIVKKLIDSGTSAGTYYVWANIVDNPEIEPLLLQGPIIVA